MASGQRRWSRTRSCPLRLVGGSRILFLCLVKTWSVPCGAAIRAASAGVAMLPASTCWWDAQWFMLRGRSSRPR
eukprot:11113882-Alexandrium_andersonii.AAC.1